MTPKSGETVPLTPEELCGAVSFEAWILPDSAEAGRILDKITGGQRDGFLLDCWPELSLRLIVGRDQLDCPNVLKPDVWQHVVVVIDRGIPRVYLDGRSAINSPQR